MRAHMGHHQRPSNLWHVDGSLRDVYCSPCTHGHWDAFLCFARSYEPSYSFDGENEEIPRIHSIFANREGAHLLVLRVGAAHVHCHFFDCEEIELDIDPREVHDDGQHDLMMQFFSELATAIGLPVRVTPENSRDRPFFTIDPGASVLMRADVESGPQGA